MVLNFDVCIVGCGIAGAYLSFLLKRAGFDIVVVEQKNLDACWASSSKNVTYRISERFFRRMGITPNNDYFDYFKEINIMEPSGNLLSQIKLELMYIDRSRISRAIRNLLEINEIYLLNDRVVNFKQPKNKTDFWNILTKSGKKIECSLFVDASGVLSNIRQIFVRQYNHYEWNIKPNMFYIEHVYTRSSKNDSENFDIIFDDRIAYKGLISRFTKRKKQIIGLREPLDVSPIIPVNNRFNYLRILLNEKNHYFKHNLVIYPSSKPIYDAVDHGFMLIGEAAFHANPLISFGIYDSFLSAEIAYSVINELDLMYPPSKEDLWSFNRKYFKYAGKYLLAFYALKKFIRKTKNLDIYKLIRLLPERVSTDLSFDPLETYPLINKLVQPKIFWRIYDLARIIKEILEYGDKYPESQEGFKKWTEKIDKILADAIQIP